MAILKTRQMKKKHSTSRKNKKERNSTNKQEEEEEEHSEVCFVYNDIGICEERAEYGSCFLCHPIPNTSRTLLLSDIYQRLQNVNDPALVQLHFEEFYENLYTKLSKYGEVMDLIVCDYVPENMYMAGHAFVQYRTKKQASIALENLRGSYHDGIPVIVSFSPVKHLRDYLCPGYERVNICHRHDLDGVCILKHIKKTRRAYPIKKNMMKSHLVVGGGGGGGDSGGDASPSVHESDPDSCITE